MSIDKHVHFEMDIAKRPDAQKTKTKLYFFFFFHAGYICRELYQIDTARLSHTCTKRTACQSDDNRKMQKSKLWSMKVFRSIFTVWFMFMLMCGYQRASYNSSGVNVMLYILTQNIISSVLHQLRKSKKEWTRKRQCYEIELCRIICVACRLTPKSTK